MFVIAWSGSLQIKTKVTKSAHAIDMFFCDWLVIWQQQQRTPSLLRLFRQFPTRGPAALACRPFNTRASYDPISHKFLTTLCELLFWTSKNALFCPFGTCRCHQFPLRAPSHRHIVTLTSLPRHRYLTPLNNGHWDIGLNSYKWAFPGPRRVLRNTTRQSVFDCQRTRMQCK